MADSRPVVAAGFVPPRGYQDAVHVRDGREWLVLGGHVAFDSQRRLLHPGDLVAQFRVVLSNLRGTLAAAGFAQNQVAKLTVHVVDVDDYRAKLKELGQVWREVWGGEYPAMTLLGVSKLFDVGALVEIDGLAIR